MCCYLQITDEEIEVPFPRSYKHQPVPWRHLAKTEPACLYPESLLKTPGTRDSVSAELSFIILYLFWRWTPIFISVISGFPPRISMITQSIARMGYGATPSLLLLPSPTSVSTKFWTFCVCYSNGYKMMTWKSWAPTQVINTKSDVSADLS